MTRLARLAAGVLVLGMFVPAVARAGGFQLTDRGARPLGRGGAFVAGADDASALWYNPAGLGGIASQLHFDATLTLLDASFRRIDGGGNVLPTVDADPMPLPIPMIAYASTFGQRDLAFAFGLFAPNWVLLRWPEEVTVAGETDPRPAPQRYSLISEEGSALVHIAAGAAWQPADGLSIGLTLQLIVGNFRTVTAMSACDRVICTQPENPEYDGLAELTLAGAVAPSAIAGITYRAGIVRLGASVMLPYALSGDAEMRVRLPSAAVFDGAYMDGTEAGVEIDLPWILRAGVEVAPDPALRLEGAVVYEGWSTQDALRVDPHDVWIRNARAIGDYQVGPLEVPRGMNDTVSVRLGGEYAVGAARRVTVRGGVSWENGAFSDEYLTPLTLDSDKVVASLGATFQVGGSVLIDVMAAHVFLTNREVRTSAVPQPNPIRPPPDPMSPPPDGPVFIGNGDYAMEANVVGVGLRWLTSATAQPEREPVPVPAPVPDAGPDSETEPRTEEAGDPELEPGERPGTGAGTGAGTETPWWLQGGDEQPPVEEPRRPRRGRRNRPR